MSTQRLTWTALPWGRMDDGRPRLSAYLAPRLEDAVTAEPTLATDFPDFLDWPAIVNHTRFEVQLPGGGEIATERLTAPADSALWRKLFPETTPVSAFVFRDHSARRIRSYPVRDVLAYVRDLYREVARTSGEDLPLAPGVPGAHPALGRLVADLGGLFGVNADNVRITDRNRLQAAAKAHYEEPGLWQVGQRALNFHGAVPTTYGTSRPTFHFAAALRFYDRPESRDEYLPEPDAALVPPRPESPNVDFHQMLTVLGDHPVLLRLLGLVVDLALDEEPPAPTGKLRVSPTYGGRVPSPSLPSFRPWTVYRLDARHFVPERAGVDVGEGMLLLDSADDALDAAPTSLFDLVQVDPDGAALKLANTASTLYSLQLAGGRNQTGIDTPDDAGLPALRSGGLSIVRSDRGVLLAQRVANAAGWNGVLSEDSIELYADELTRGYRVDVQRGDNPWRSLHRRRGQYTLHDSPVKGADGKTEFVDEGYVKGSSATSHDAAGSDLHLHETVARWSGWSLAAERPGKLTYPSNPGGDRTRQDETVKEKLAPELATTFKLDARYDVVPGSLPRLRFGDRYRLRARAVDLAGNSRPHDDPDDAHASEWIDYLRYEPVGPPDLLPLEKVGPGEALERLVVRSNFDSGIDAPCERHVIPPKTSQYLAELHGAFDDAIGAGRPHDPAHDVSAREAQQLTDMPGTVKQPAGPPPPKGSPDNPGTYYTNPKRALVLPYLPDVLSSGASFRGLPGTTGPDATLQDWGDGEWPDARPFILRIEERPADPAGVGACRQVFANPPPEPEWDADARMLTVRLAKGEVARVRYSSFLPREARDLLGVWRWAMGADDDALERLALDGRHWMLTPFRTLTLVHAVQQPLCKPSVLPPEFPDEWGFEGIDPSRTEGATYADLSAHVLLSVRTTALIDVDAEWTEQVDDKLEAGQNEHRGKSHVATVPVPIELPEGPNRLPFSLGQHRSGEPVRHEFGDTKHRLVKYRLTATTRFREYFPPGTDPITQIGEPVSAHVPSSAQPDAPRVLYAVPTFAWSRTRTPDEAGWRSARNVRSGGGLRVYMDRTWYSSGDDELLGAVVWTGGNLKDHEPWWKLVSQIGRDPIWDTGSPAPLSLADFAGAARTETGLKLAERLDGGIVAAAGYRPEYDTDRRLWTADVLLPGPANRSYYPFVRVALARYQHYSIAPWLKLSTVVPLDFAQLAPDRTLGVDWVDERRLDVSLSGVAPDGPNGNSVEVTIETHEGTVPGELGWRPWPALPPVVLPEGIRHVNRWLEHVGLHAVAVEALNLGPRLRYRPGKEQPTEIGAIDPAHLPLVESARAADLGLLPRWIDVEHEIPIAVLLGHRVWSGRLELPVERSKRPLRLVVREYETYLTDAEAAGSANPEPRVYHARRIVFTDTVEL